MASNSPGQNTTLESADVSRAPRIVFLLSFLVVSFVGSIFIIIVLAHNTRLRTVQNLLIANMCVMCLIDCVFNMALVLGSLCVDTWVYGAFMCKANSFFMNLVAIETVLMLTALSIDRYFSLRFSHRYEAWLSSYRIWSVIVYFWLHSLTFSIPFLTDAVASTFRPQLHLCTVTGDTSLPFLYITLIICFVAPLIIITVFHILNARLSCQQRYATKAEMAQKNYTQMLNDKPPQTQHQSHPSSYTAILFVLWLILEVPFIITSYIKQYQYSQSQQHGSIIDYPWEVDATFIWMRFFFSALFPFVTFFFKKEVWQSAKECVLCRKHNSVVDMEIVGVASDISGKSETPPKNERELTPKAKEKEMETPQPLAFSVPVLFATSTGICIEDTSVRCNLDSTLHAMSTEDMLKGKALDITYPEYEYADELIGDTSDYDSSCEIDRYSSSQPVSTRNVHGTLHRTRSMSDPEISTHSAQENKVKDKNKVFSGSSGADSGLDLSGTTGSIVGGMVKSRTKTDQRREVPMEDVSTSPVYECVVENHKEDCDYDITHKQQLPVLENPCFPKELEYKEGSEKQIEMSKRPLPPRLRPIDNKSTTSSASKTKRKRYKARRKEEQPVSSLSSPARQNQVVAVDDGCIESSRISKYSDSSSQGQTNHDSLTNSKLTNGKVMHNK